MERSLHNHSDDNTFPVRGIKLCHRLIPIPQFLHDLDSRCLILREYPTEFHEKSVSHHPLPKSPEIGVSRCPGSKERNFIVVTIGSLEGSNNSIRKALHEDILRPFPFKTKHFSAQIDCPHGELFYTDNVDIIFCGICFARIMDRLPISIIKGQQTDLGCIFPLMDGLDILQDSLGIQNITTKRQIDIIDRRIENPLKGRIIESRNFVFLKNWLYLDS